MICIGQISDKSLMQNHKFTLKMNLLLAYIKPNEEGSTQTVHEVPEHVDITLLSNIFSVLFFPILDKDFSGDFIGPSQAFSREM
jgi:hypothetical protein